MGDQRVTVEPLLSAREVATILGVSVDTVYRKAQTGQIPVELKVGPMWRFDRAKVYAALTPKEEES